MYYRRKLKNSGSVDRPKAFLGALIGAGTTIASAIINSNAQKEQARLQHELDLKTKAIEEANSMAQAYNLTENAQKAYEQQFRTPYAKGGRRKLRHGIQITDGGYAIPVGDNTYLLRGSSHQDINETGQTGIGIKANGTEIEAENGEVLQKKGNQLRIFSNSLNDNGETPAQEVLEGKNKDKVFARQQAKNGGSSPVEGMRTKAADGIGGWLSSLFNSLSWEDIKETLGLDDNTLSYLYEDLTNLGFNSSFRNNNGVEMGIAPIPGRAGGYRPNTAQINRWTQQAQRVNQAARRSMARTPAPATVTHTPRIFNAGETPVETARRMTYGWGWTHAQPFEQAGYVGSRLGRLNRDVYNLTHYGQNNLRGSLNPWRFGLGAIRNRFNPAINGFRNAPWGNIGRYSLAGAGTLGGLGLTGYFVNRGAKDYFNNQSASSDLVSPEADRIINSPIDTLVVPRDSSAIVNDSTLVNNPDSVLDADTIAAMTDSINSARDTVSNARAAIRSMGTDTTRTSRPDSTTISNKDFVDRIRQAALQEIMDNNPNGPNNRQLNAMVANGTIETAFGDDEPVVQPTNSTVSVNRQPVVNRPSNNGVSQPVATRVTTPADGAAVKQTQEEIARDLERRFDNTPLDQIGRDANNRSAADYPYLTGNVETPPSDWNDSYYDEGPTWNRYANYVEANKKMNEASNRIIASQKNKKGNGTRGFDLGADFKPVDYANAGIGILGSILSHAITKSSLRGLEKYAPTRPALYRAGKLVTNYNINPQLTNLERARQQGYNTVDSNTSSSVATLDRRNTIGLNTALAANELYGTKYNTEAELLNKDTLNQQEIANKNVEAYNQYMTDRRNYLAGLATRRSLSNVGLIQGIGSSLSNMIQSGMDRYDNNNEIGVILSAAYPESINYIRRNNPRLARRLGIA